MDALLIFLLATVVSFIGSLQAGLVNTAVLATTLRSGKEAGRSMAIGGAIPEFLYAGTAFAFGTWISTLSSSYPDLVNRIAAATFIGMGIYFLMFFKLHLDRPAKATTGMWKGLLIGLANPQLLLFWCGVKLMLVSFGMRGESTANLFAFAAGAFVGAIILLMILVRLGVKAQERMSPNGLQRLFRSIGLVLLGCVLYGLLRAQGSVP